MGKIVKVKNQYKKGHFIETGLIIGIPSGIPFGLILGNIAYGPFIGVILGLTVGVILEKMLNKNPVELTAEEKFKKNKLWKTTLNLGLVVFISILLLLFLR